MQWVQLGDHKFGLPIWNRFNFNSINTNSTQRRTHRWRTNRGQQTILCFVNIIMSPAVLFPRQRLKVHPPIHATSADLPQSTQPPTQTQRVLSPDLHFRHCSAWWWLPRLRFRWNPLPPIRQHPVPSIDGNLCVALFMTDLSQVNDMRPLIYIANTNMPAKWRAADRWKHTGFTVLLHVEDDLVAKEALMSTPDRIEREYIPFDPNYWMNGSAEQASSSCKKPAGRVK